MDILQKKADDQFCAHYILRKMKYRDVKRIGIHIEDYDHYVFQDFTAKRILIQSSHEVFFNANDYPSDEIPIIQTLRWHLFSYKPDAFLLMSIPTRHAIVIGSSTSSHWLNSNGIYVAPRKKWHSDYKMIEKLRERNNK